MDRAYNILVVEDNAEHLSRMQSALAQSTLVYTLKCVDSIELFQREISSFPPDLVLAELSLPQFDALEALRWLNDHQIDVPLIIVTGARSEEVAVDCMKRGAVDYVSKDALLRLPSAVSNAIRRMDAERERATTERQYRLIAEGTRDLITLLDRKYEVLYASASFERILKHPPAELESIPFLSMVHPDDVAPLEKCLEETLFFREARNLELRLCHAGGNWHRFEATVSHIFDEGGKPLRALIVSRDTSERERAEVEIRKLAAFARHNPNPVLEFACDGSLAYFNDAAMELARSLKRPHPQMILPLETATIVKRCLGSGKNRLHLETRIGTRVVTWSFYPILTNQVVHCYAEEVTQSRQLEASLRQAQKMDSIGQLAAGVAHDFNNILTVISGHASLMQTCAKLDELPAQSVKQIAAAAEKAAGLTRQLLMFSRKQLLQPQLLDLNEIISNVSKMVRAMLGERITLHCRLGDGLPALHADPGMLEQILVNLTVNGRDAITHNGTVTVETTFHEVTEAYCRNHPDARPGGFVRLSVSDTGQGMDEETKARIFEPFFTTKEIGHGTGLGLATVYGIVQQHQGWIEVQSVPGEGSTFHVYLPISTKNLHQARSLLSEASPGGTETILVVEDEPSLRELVQAILIKKGYRVLEAPDGVKALEVWQRHKDEIALLLTDMMMPEGVSGRDLAEKVLSERTDLKVLFTSGYNLEMIEPGFAVGRGQSFLQKPYHPETLAKAVREILNHN